MWPVVTEPLAFGGDAPSFDFVGNGRPNLGPDPGEDKWQEPAYLTGSENRGFGSRLQIAQRYKELVQLADSAVEASEP